MPPLGRKHRNRRDLSDCGRGSERSAAVATEFPSSGLSGEGRGWRHKRAEATRFVIGTKGLALSFAPGPGGDGYNGVYSIKMPTAFTRFGPHELVYWCEPELGW